MTVELLTDSILLLYQRYIVNIEVMVLFLARMDVNVHLSKPDVSCPLFIIEENIVLSDTIDVPPS